MLSFTIERVREKERDLDKDSHIHYKLKVWGHPLNFEETAKI